METFLNKAMRKLNPSQDVVTPEVKEETTVPKEETTVVPTNKAKLVYKQQTLSNIMSGGIQTNGK